MNHSSQKVRAIVVGAGGYSGAEAAGLLLTHPAVEVVGLFGSGAREGAKPEAFTSAFPRYRGLTDLLIEPSSAASLAAAAPDVAFLATPHEASEALVPTLLSSGVTVYDLSAAFRLGDAALYPKHYGFTHSHPELLAQAVYGLAELNAAAIRTANLIAVPGCYPTSVALPMRPLAEAGLITDDLLIVDSTSGVSGAGRAASTKSLFCEVSLQAYGVFSHRHQPEMEQEVDRRVVFTPHLGAFDRGILSTIHATLAPGATLTDCRTALEAAYAGAQFVRLLPAGAWPSVAAVRMTNCCDIGLAADESRNHLIVSSAIDNLLKGAAGQAVQCMNIRLGLPEWTALPGAASPAPIAAVRTRPNCGQGVAPSSQTPAGAAS